MTENPINETTNTTNDNHAAIRKILPLVHELAESVNQNIYMGMEGTGEMSAGLYRALHAKIVRLMPDDDYITAALVLKYPKGTEDDNLLGVVNLAIRQLVAYLKNELGETDKHPGGRREKRKLRRIIEEDDDDEDENDDVDDR
jgi:hypothetical protein